MTDKTQHPPSDTILEARGIGKHYKNRWVVENVNLQIRSGEIVGLLGPNGAGKTTSFYMIVGLVQPDKGKIFYNNEDITRLAIHSRARLGIGYLPQEASVFRKLSVADNILAILQMRSDLSAEAQSEHLETLLSEFNITSIRQNMAFSLSGGERRRLEIARALAVNPKFMLLDEPFAGIDPISVIDIKRIIKHLKSKNIGVLITDHNVRDTLETCERAYICNQGQILHAGTPQSILMNQQVREVYLGEDFNL